MNEWAIEGTNGWVERLDLHPGPWKRKPWAGKKSFGRNSWGSSQTLWAPRGCSAPAWDTALMQCSSGLYPDWTSPWFLLLRCIGDGGIKPFVSREPSFHDSTPRLGNCLLSPHGPPTAHHHLFLLPTRLQPLRPGTVFFHFWFSKTVVDTELLNIAIFKASWAFLSCWVGQGWG